MNTSRFHSLRFRFLAGSVLLLMLLFGLVSLNTHRVLQKFALENTRSLIGQTSETLNLAIAPHTTTEELDTLDDYLDELVTGDELGIVYLALLGEDGRILVSTSSTPVPLPDSSVDLRQQLDTGTVHVGQPILLADNRVGLLRYGLSTRLLQSTNRRLLHNNLLLLAGGLMVSILILTTAGIRVGKQLGHLVQASQALAAGDLTIRAPETGTNELSYLAHNFNRMADAVAERTVALQENKSKLRAMLNNPALLIGLLDTDGNTLMVNDATLALHYSRADEIQGRPFWDTPPFKHDSSLQQRLREAIRTGAEGTASRFEITYDTQAGLREAEFSLQPVTDAQGIVTWLVPQVIDITERKRAEQQLARANAEWTQAMDQFDDPIYLLDMQQHLVRANQAFYGMIDSTPEHSLGRHIRQLLHPDGELKPCLLCEMQLAGRESVVTLEPDEYFSPNGRPTEASLKVLRDAAGTETGMLISLHDLTHSRRLEESLRLSAGVFENTAEGVVITDADGTVLEVNRATTEILGYSREELIGQNPKIWNSGRHDDGFYRAMWRSLKQTGHWRGEIWNRRKDGTVFPVWETISDITDKNGLLTHYVVVFSDISQIKQSQEQLDYLAHHDALTDLPNRLLLNERLEQAIRHAERNQTQIAIIFFDLDNFKHINDSLGHPVGDKLLQEVAAKLQHTIRVDDTVARIGGDEFVLLLEDIGKAEHAGIIAEKLISILNTPFDLEGQEIGVTASMGICLYPRDGHSPAVLMRNADAAMYRAKEEGRNTFQFYTEELTRNAFERILLETNLRQAIERKELRLLFQPQVNVVSRQLIGVEALIRWQHPELGLVTPSRFIPLAEECGLIRPIGEWVLYEACLQGRKWLDQGLNFGRIAINIAGSQINRGELVEQVKRMLADTGFPAYCLELEVTEGFIMQQAKAAIDQLEELRRLGVTLTIDDFGTGHSSLSYLKQLPIHKLKIDRSFITDIPYDANDMAISHAIIALGKSLGLCVIAEGVEKADQAKFLEQAGCQEGQGYLYGRPVTPDELVQSILTPTP